LALCLESIYGSYLEALRAEEEARIRSPYFVTDLHKCPRQLVLKWRGTPPDERNPLWGWQRLRKFDDANHNHDRMGAALERAGQLLVTEFRVSEVLPRDLGGRLDYLADLRPNGYSFHVIDMKNPDPRMKPENTPKPSDIDAITLYTYAVRELGQDCGDPILCYAWAAGGGPMIAYMLPYEEFRPGAMSAVADLAEVYAHHKQKPGWLPNPLPKVVEKHGTKVAEEPDWRCSKMYCPYAWGEHCTPEDGSRTLAERPRKKAGQEAEPEFAFKTDDPGERLAVSRCLDEWSQWQVRRANWYLETGYECWEANNGG